MRKGIWLAAFAAALVFGTAPQAAENHNSSRSNRSTQMAPGVDPLKSCNDQCGKLEYDASGKLMCTVPPQPACWSSASVPPLNTPSRTPAN